MAKENDHYKRLEGRLQSGKDSIFEPCRILAYDGDTMTATVIGMRSMQQKDNVLVLSPSLFLNSGVIHPPVPNSTGILFWGSDRQTFLFPVQFTNNGPRVENGVVKESASPKDLDDSFDLSFVDSGEVFQRSLGGSQVYLKNDGTVEMKTTAKDGLTISGEDGSMQYHAESEVKEVSDTRYFLGVKEDKSDEGSVFMTSVFEGKDVPTADDIFADLTEEELLNRAMNENDTAFLMDSIPQQNLPDFKHQSINVFDEGSKRVFLGNHPLFERLELSKDGNHFSKELSWIGEEKEYSDVNGVQRTKETFMNGFDKKVKDENAGNENVWSMRDNESSFVINNASGDSSGVFFTDKQSKLMVNNEIISVDETEGIQLFSDGKSVEIKNNSTSLRVSSNDVVFETTGGTFSLDSILQRINDLSALHDINPL